MGMVPVYPPKNLVAAHRCWFDRNYSGSYPAVCDYTEPLTPKVSSYLDKTQQLALHTPQAADGTRIAFFADHNEAYLAIHRAIKEGALAPNAVYLHFDTHNDAGINVSATVTSGVPPLPTDGLEKFSEYVAHLGIATFITALLYERVADEMYWVAPSWIGTASPIGQCFWGQVKDKHLTAHVGSTNIDFSTVPFRESETTYIYLTKDNATAEEAMKKSPARAVQIHSTTLEGLPDFQHESRPVIVDIDQDYLDNTGFDTHCGVTVAHDQAKLKERIRQLIAGLREKHIQPSMITISGSPDYTYTSNTDDAAVLLLGGFLQSGLLEKVSVQFGEPGFSSNTYELARALFLFVRNNFENDPRIQPKDVSQSDVEVFQNDIVEIIMQTYNEERFYYYPTDRDRSRADHVLSKALPQKSGEYFTLPSARGDYQFFIEQLEEMGLQRLANIIYEHAALQSSNAIDPIDLERSYTTVFEALQPLMIDL